MKYISMLVALLLSLVMLTACGGEENPTVQDGSTPTQVGNEQELQDILERVAYLPVGTMGVTLKTTEVAAVALDWCENTSMTGQQLADALDAYYAQTTDREMYVEQMYSVASRMVNFADSEYRNKSLTDAGFDAENYGWTDKAFTLADVFRNAVDRWLEAPTENGTEPCFKATVEEVRERSLLVTPLEGEDERNSADRIHVSLPEQAPSVQVGDTVQIEYNGMIMESYPAQITADVLTVVTE